MLVSRGPKCCFREREISWKLGIFGSLGHFSPEKLSYCITIMKNMFKDTYVMLSKYFALVIAITRQCNFLPTQCTVCWLSSCPEEKVNEADLSKNNVFTGLFRIKCGW